MLSYCERVVESILLQLNVSLYFFLTSYGFVLQSDFQLMCEPRQSVSANVSHGEHSFGLNFGEMLFVFLILPWLGHMTFNVTSKSCLLFLKIYIF